MCTSISIGYESENQFVELLKGWAGGSLDENSLTISLMITKASSWLLCDKTHSKIN